MYILFLIITEEEEKKNAKHIRHRRISFLLSSMWFVIRERKKDMQKCNYLSRKKGERKKELKRADEMSTYIFI
jgi:hypothetical protein